MSARDRHDLTTDERRLLDEAIARGLLTAEGVVALLEKREVDEDGELQPISQLLLLTRALAVPDYLALKRSLAEPRAPARPASFGPYRVIRELARGTHTALFEAEGPSGMRVAVKALLALTDASAQKRQRLETEVRALARLAHPGIARIHGAANEGGLPYFVLDLAPGQPLDRVLAERGPLEPVVAAHVVAQVALAVGHAHERGVLHRDLRPANVLWGGPGTQPVLVGFGLAKVLGLDARATLPGEIVGAPAYLPPEAARPSLGTVGPPSEVYALGAILYELLAGEPPFAGRSVGEILSRVLDEPPTPIRSVRPDVPEALAAVVAQALEKSPGARPQRAPELAELLRRATGTPASEPRRARPTVPVATPAQPRAAPEPRPIAGSPRVRALRLARAAAVVLAVELPLLVGIVAFESAASRRERLGQALELEGARRLGAAANYAGTLERARGLAPRELPRAIALASSVASRRPDRPEAFAVRAELRARAGDRLALEDARHARELVARAIDPGDRLVVEREASLAEARVAFELELPDALDAIRHACELGEPEALTLRTRALVRRGELDEAGKDVTRAEQEHASPSSLARARAALLVARGDVDAALGLLELTHGASPREPDDPDMGAARSDALAASGRLFESVAVLRELTALVPSHPAYALALARTLALVEEWDEAAQTLERARKLGADDPGLARRLDAARGVVAPETTLELAARADCLLDADRFVEARALLESSLARNPAPEATHALERARLRVLAQAREPAALELAQTLEVEKGPPQLLVSVAACYRSLGRPADAARVADRALELDRANLGALLLRGPARALAVLGEASSAASFETAARELEESLAHLPERLVAESGEAQHLLARLDLSLRRTTEGLRAVEAARARSCRHALELASLEDALRLEPPPAPLRTDAERLAVEACEIGDGVPAQATEPDLVVPVFGRGCVSGRAGLLFVARALSTDRTRHELVLPASPAPALALDLRGRGSLVALVAARSEAGDLAVELALMDAGGRSRRLRSRRAVVRADGAWGELRVPLAGDEVWESAGGGFDLAHVARLLVAFEGSPGKSFSVWLDGLRGE